MRSLLARLLVLAPALVVFVACSSESTPDVPLATDYASATERGAFAVGVTTLELVDTSRPTAPNGDFPGSDERALTVEIWYPAEVSGAEPETADAALDASAGPYPLIVFAHGFSATRRQSTTYTQHLASHGYVVAAPQFPLSSGGSPGGPRLADLVNQPADVSFVIDEVLALNDEDGHLLAGAIDVETIGLTGHSLGGFTTLLTLYGADRDPRIDAALAISGSGCFLTEDMVGDVSVPLVLLTGAEDLIVSPAGNRRAYDLANPPRYWVEITGGNHVRFADADIDDAAVVEALSRLIGTQQAEDSESDVLAQAADSCAERRQPTGNPTLTLDEQQEALRAWATPFFDAFLRDSAAARSFLENDLLSLVDASFEYER